MKPRQTLLKLLAPILFLAAIVIWTSWSVQHVKAIQDSEDFPVPFGVARDQTARLTLFNIGDTAIVGPEYKFLNSRGETLGRSEERIVVLPGQFRSFDFDLPNPPPGTVDLFGRAQIRAVVSTAGNSDIKTMRVSIEVFDKDTGKTTVLISPPPDPE